MRDRSRPVRRHLAAALAGVLVLLLPASPAAQRAAQPTARPVQAQLRATISYSDYASCNEDGASDHGVLRYSEELVGYLDRILAGGADGLASGKAERRVRATFCAQRCPEGECPETCSWEADLAELIPVVIHGGGRNDAGGSVELRVDLNDRKKLFRFDVRNSSCPRLDRESARHAVTGHRIYEIADLVADDFVIADALSRSGQTFRIVDDGRQIGTLTIVGARAK